jgi:peptidoglycan-N-acetylglucosamine deacetylase
MMPNETAGFHYRTLLHTSSKSPIGRQVSPLLMRNTQPHIKPRHLCLAASFAALTCALSLFSCLPAAAQMDMAAPPHSPRKQNRPLKPAPEIKVNTWRGSRVVKLWRGDPASKEIALTFDDGPHPAATVRLLDLLRELHVKATFFVVGKKVDEAPWLLPRMLVEGHEVANHTYHHINLDNAPESVVMSEIKLGADAIQRACGVKTNSFRPPGGHHNDNVLSGAEKMGVRTFLWSDDPADFANPGADVLEQRLIGKVTGGALVLLHDGIEQTMEILPDLIARLRKEGYRFVTVSQLADHLEAATAHHASASVSTPAPQRPPMR